MAHVKLHMLLEVNVSAEGGVEVEGAAAVVASLMFLLRQRNFLTHNAIIVLSLSVEISWRDIKCCGNIDISLFALYDLTNVFCLDNWYLL